MNEPGDDRDRVRIRAFWLRIEARLRTYARFSAVRLLRLTNREGFYLAAATLISIGRYGSASIMALCPESLGLSYRVAGHLLRRRRRSRLLIYLAPAAIILLYEWFHRADRRAKADEELLAAVGSIETVNTLRQNYPALDWSFRNHNSEIVAKIGAHAREAGRITAEQAAALERLAEHWDRA